MNDNANVSIDATTKNWVYVEIGGMFFPGVRWPKHTDMGHTV
jgi:hypothetical protein